ncbi:MAG TPA: hypothetical protein VGJ10_06055 [Paraburkholderia sp.]
MADETTQANGKNGAAEGLRDIPSDIGEYSKFVKDGGLEHNEKIRNRETAVAAAKAAGLEVPAAEPGESQEKHRNGFQARVGRLQRKIGERDAQIEDLRKQLEARASSAPANGTAKPDAEKPAAAAPAVERPNGEAKTPPRPKEEDFKTYAAFVEALTDWTADRKLEAADAKRADVARNADAEAKSKAVTDAHNARVDEAKTRYPDWDKAFKGLDDNSFTDPMVVFIFESDKGPDVTYYLATHREELERIAKLSPLRQAAALGKIEDQFEEPPDDDEEEEEDTEEKKGGAEGAKTRKPAAEPEPAKPRKRVSQAPPPAKPLGGKAGADDPMPDPTNFKAYAAWSQRQAAKGVKR